MNDYLERMQEAIKNLEAAKAILDNLANGSEYKRASLMCRIDIEGVIAKCEELVR
jgi:hypothetical protein